MTDKTTKVIAWIALIVAIGAVVVAVKASPKMSASLGSAGGMLVENYDPYNRYNDGYKSENEIVLSGADGDITTGDDLTVTDDAIVSGGTLTVTTAAGATSTLTIGEIETYATSSTQLICLKFAPQATTTSPVVANNGYVLWAYGACP